ncbi:MAG: hypothetical protein HYV29_09435 [Ignavibacteriales bacterium]|nr:hypothetical protein [Ignavibacteriales bacterium]
MNIRWTLDTEEKLDPADPLGSITFEDDDNSFTESNVYLDDWFESLIQGIEAISSGKNRVVIEINSEPNKFTFENKNGFCQLTFKNKTLLISNIDDFSADLKSQILSVTKHYSSDDITKMDNWTKLLKFAYS